MYNYSRQSVGWNGSTPGMTDTMATHHDSTAFIYISEIYLESLVIFTLVAMYLQ
jgi:hypothetical protein